MKTPFIFGRVAEGKAFINREKDIIRLGSNFENNVNTILISPRRWGKSSLVLKAADYISNKNDKIRFCFLDLFNLRNENEFYESLAKEVIKSVSGKVSEMTSIVGKFFKRIKPRISFGGDPLHDFKLSFDMEELRLNEEEILNLPEKLAIKKKIQMIICIDEFQNMQFFKDPLHFQKKLRSFWQRHQNVSYCLYGSKRHLLMNLFESQSMPFYKFGDVIYLEKIPPGDFIKFIIESFNKTGKEISGKFAEEITKLMNNHPYYIQQFSHILWTNTTGAVDQVIFESSIDDLLNQNSMLYYRETEGLSEYQLNMLRALVDGKIELHSQSVIRNYRLGTSSNVTKLKNGFIDKEIIDASPKKIEFMDPAFELWLRRKYFK